jgi:lysophospholipase L1-like esterase
VPAPDDALLRFCHPERILATTRLPGLDALDADVLAGLYGIDAAAHERTRERWRREVELALQGALDDRLVRRLRGLPFARGDRVVVIGDSITADRQSWAELLALALAEIGAGVTVVNGGLSGDTTTGALARSRSLRATRPDHVLVLLGTNDARRHGRADGEMLVSHRETARNLDALRGRFRDTPVAWITPPPVAPARIARDALLREGDVTWRLADVAAKRRIVRARPEPVVDVWPAFTPELLLADGLHPSLAGHVAILRAVSRLGGRGR